MLDNSHFLLALGQRRQATGLALQFFITPRNTTQQIKTTEKILAFAWLSKIISKMSEQFN